MSEQKQKHRLIEYLERIASEISKDTGTLANLRRALQDPVLAYPYVLPYLSEGEAEYHLDTCCLLASLFAMHQLSTPKGNMGSHMRIAAGNDTAATEHRFVALLRAHPDDLQTHLRHAISFLKSEEQSVNWQQLLRDLKNWNHEDGFVQKEWARGFWGSRADEPQEN